MRKQRTHGDLVAAGAHTCDGPRPAFDGRHGGRLLHRRLRPWLRSRALRVGLFYVPVLANLAASAEPCGALVILGVNAAYNCPTGQCGGPFYSNLQTALQDAAVYAESDTVEVWVAAGQYRPDLGTGSRSMSFRLRNRVRIFGGFSGDFTVHDPLAYPTFLSGEINSPNLLEDNSYHVVDGSLTYPPTSHADMAMLSGCIIEQGFANGPSPADRVGGGMICLSGSPVINNCVFQWNAAQDAGGAVYAASSYPWILVCQFRSNLVGSGYGGALYLQGGAALVEYTVFLQNSASALTGAIEPSTLGYGGAVHNEGGSPLYRGCRFYANMALHGGGGVSNRDHSAMTYPEFRDCIIWGNHAVYVGGGGLFAKDSHALVDNCTFSGNLANTGGEILSFASHCSAHNSIIWGNPALNRSRVVPEVLQHIGFFDFDPSFTLRESGGQVVLFGSTLSAAYCNVQGGVESIYADSQSSVDWGAGNLTPPVDPLLTGAGTLQAGSPCIDQGDPGAAVSIYDVDGEQRVLNGRVDLGADEFRDSDLDGLPDVFEQSFPGGTRPGADPDLDGLSNLTEHMVGGLEPRLFPIYVNGTTGNDAYTGQSQTVEGGGAGPKRTIQAAIDAASSGGTILVAPGTYSGTGNTDLNLDFKNLAIRAVQGPAVTHIDGGGLRRAFAHDQITALPVWIEGFRFTRLADEYGGALRFNNGRHVWLRNCELISNHATVQAGGLCTVLNELDLDGLTLRDNTAPDGTCGLIFTSSLNLRGDLNVENGRLMLYSGHVRTPAVAPRSIRLGPDAMLVVSGFAGGEPLPPSVIKADIIGTGGIQIDAGQQLIIGGNTVVNLSGQSGDVCSVPDAGAPSRIKVDGSLVVQDSARILRNSIDVSLLKLGSGAEIRYNDIAAPLDSSGFGGEFFVETDPTGAERVSVTCNRISAVGDRYLDLDPDPALPPDRRPLIQGNHLEVTIVEGTAGQQGTILELRARDFHCDPDLPGGCRSGTLQPNLVPWADRNQFDGDAYPANNWVLAQLAIQQNAKLNLTNRQGFDFNLDRPDTIYVKDLVLEPGAVLNLANQRMYYNTISIGEGAQIVNVPLLGFSLGIIGMNDDNEFSVRVRRRLTDPDADANPQDPAAPPPPRGDIRRLPDGLTPGDGVMEISTQAAGEPRPATSVAAKGHFTRAGEDAILIIFLYLFQDAQPDSELVVKLSGNRDVGQENLEIARIRQEPGRPGSFGSNEWAVFHMSVPRGDLNLTRGTFVELELRSGRDPQDPAQNLPARVWIENWDPQITCSQVGQCGDLNNSFARVINERDYLLLVAACGQAIEPDDPIEPQPSYPLWCLDLSGDKYVDLTDLLRWDVFFTTQLDLCAPEGGSGLSGPSAHAQSGAAIGTGLVLAGKERTLTSTPDDPVAKAKYLDHLYAVDPGSVSVNAAGATHIQGSPCPRPGAAPAGGAASIGNGRIILDNTGAMFQIHEARGIYRLDRAGGEHQLIVPPMSNLPHPAAPGSMVHVGLTPTGGKRFLGQPLSDAAIRTVGDQTHLYVVPVVVSDSANGCSYKAAAKLRLTGGSPPYVVERVYSAPGCHPAGTWSSLDVHQLREIEIGADGRRLYVASAQAFNSNDDLLVFDEALPAPIQTVSLHDLALPDLPRAPVALHAAGDHLYLSSPVRALDGQGLPAGDPHARLLRFMLQPDGALCTAGGCGPRAVTVHNPCIGAEPECVSNPNPLNPMVGYITAVVEAAGAVWVSGYVTPTFRDNEVPAGTDLFTVPTLALLRPEWFDAPPPAVTAARLDCQGLALPVAAAFIPSSPVDFDSDGDVDAGDLAFFSACLTGPEVGPPAAECLKMDFDGDQDIDQSDYAVIQRCFSGTNRPADANCPDSP